MKKGIQLIIGIQLLGILIYACGGGETVSVNEFTINSLEVFAGRLIENNDYYAVNKIDYHNLTDTIPTNQLGFSIMINGENYSYHMNAPLISNAMADPVPPYSKNTISLISVASNDTIYTDSRKYNPGESLANLVELSSGYMDWYSIYKFIENNGVWYQADPILFRFNTPLSKPLCQTFIFTVSMSNGKTFNLLTQKIVTK